MRSLCLFVNHLRRPLEYAGWSPRCVVLKRQKGSQGVGLGGEARGAPPSLAAGHTHTAGVSLKGQFTQHPDFSVLIFE